MSLIIRAEQMHAIAQAKVRNFAREIARSLAQRYPDEVRARGLDKPDLLLEFVNEGIARARKYQVVGRFDVQLFIECMIELGRDFDSRCAWAAAALGRDGLSGEQKMNIVHEHLVFGTARRS